MIEYYTNPNHTEYATGLPNEERLLVIIRDELYAGEWDRLVHDLKRRKDKKVEIPKLFARIDDDLKRVGKLRTYESRHEINLKDWIQ